MEYKEYMVPEMTIVNIEYEGYVCTKSEQEETINLNDEDYNGAWS